MERRKKPDSKVPEVKPTDLPYDYLRLVEQTLSQAMLKGLEEIKKIHPVSEFHVGGALYADEVVLTVTLSHGTKSLAATTVHASADFNPSADPTLPAGVALERTLGACVDAASSVYDFYLDPTQPARIAQIANASLGSLEEAPFEWTLIEQTTPKVFVKLDKSNPILEKLADQFLDEHDPDFKNKERTSQVDISVQAEEFLEERLEAIKKIRDSGSGSGFRH